MKNAKIGKGSQIQENVIVGLKYKKGSGKAILGKNSVVRAGTIIYADTKIGNNFKTGHNVLVREKTRIGNNVLLGTNTIVENKCKIGNNVSIQSNVYIPTNTIIGNNVFMGPMVCLTNDKYPLRIKAKLRGPIIEDHVTIGANATILPAIKIGKGAMIAAGAVVTKNVPPWSLAIGVPAKIMPLPKDLKKPNVKR